MHTKQKFQFSIITPTYNRADLLKRVWDSLRIQKEYISEWIVIDDGSSDQTSEFVKKFKNESDFKIVYEYTKNRGMTHAINVGLKYVEGSYFFKLDSDDYLLENSLDLIHQKINIIRTSKVIKEIKAFSFLTSYPNGKAINKFNNLINIDNDYEEKIITLDYLSARFMNSITGDLLDVFESYPLLNHFRYPVFNDESHSPSSYISYFNADFYQGQVAFVLETVLIKDYQLDGISSQRKKYNLNLPNRNLKSYLLSYLWLLNIASNQLKPLFLVSKIILKTYIILIFSLLSKLIKLIYIKLMKIFK